MKTVLILDKMPESCVECRLSVFDGASYRCPDCLGWRVRQTDKRPDWCRLQSIETVMNARCGNCKYFQAPDFAPDEPICSNGKSEEATYPMDEDDVCDEWEGE